MTKEGMGDEAMKKSLFYRAKKMPPSAQIMLLFAVEGVFLQYITSINGFGLNLFATNMGAPAVNASDTKNRSIRLSPSTGTLPRNA